MLDYNEDRWSYPVSMVIFMAAVNPPNTTTTTTTDTSARNLYETKNLQGNNFSSILAALRDYYYEFGAMTNHHFFTREATRREQVLGKMATTYQLNNFYSTQFRKTSDYAQWAETWNISKHMCEKVPRECLKQNSIWFEL